MYKNLTLDLAIWLATVRTLAIFFLTSLILASFAGAPPVTWATLKVCNSPLSSVNWLTNSDLDFSLSSCALTLAVKTK